MAASGYSAMNLLRSVTTLFFPVVVAQINLRNHILTEGLLYVEYLLLRDLSHDPSVGAQRPGGPPLGPSGPPARRQPHHQALLLADADGVLLSYPSSISGDAR